MTLDEANTAIGSRVAYTASHSGARAEFGTITKVGHLYVFVRYDGDQFSKATPPEMLTLVDGSS